MSAAAPNGNGHHNGNGYQNGHGEDHEGSEYYAFEEQPSISRPKYTRKLTPQINRMLSPYTTPGELQKAALDAQQRQLRVSGSTLIIGAALSTITLAVVGTLGYLKIKDDLSLKNILFATMNAMFNAGIYANDIPKTIAKMWRVLNDAEFRSKLRLADYIKFGAISILAGSGATMTPGGFFADADELPNGVLWLLVALAWGQDFLLLPAVFDQLIFKPFETLFQKRQWFGQKYDHDNEKLDKYFADAIENKHDKESVEKVTRRTVDFEQTKVYDAMGNTSFNRTLRHIRGNAVNGNITNYYTRYKPGTLDAPGTKVNCCTPSKLQQGIIYGFTGLMMPAFMLVVSGDMKTTSDAAGFELGCISALTMLGAAIYSKNKLAIGITILLGAMFAAFPQYLLGAVQPLVFALQSSNPIIAALAGLGMGCFFWYYPANALNKIVTELLVKPISYTASNLNSPTYFNRKGVARWLMLAGIVGAVAPCQVSAVILLKKGVAEIIKNGGAPSLLLKFYQKYGINVNTMVYLGATPINANGIIELFYNGLESAKRGSNQRLFRLMRFLFVDPYTDKQMAFAFDNDARQIVFSELSIAQRHHLANETSAQGIEALPTKPSKKLADCSLVAKYYAIKDEHPELFKHEGFSVAIER